MTFGILKGNPFLLRVYVHFSQPATLCELNRSVLPPGYAGGFKLPVIQNPRFEFEMAAVEIVKIVADKPGYGRVRLAESKFTKIAQKA
ncbi:MAG: hypothetical protein WCE56_21155 [Desulfobacterales bacterium]